MVHTPWKGHVPFIGEGSLDPAGLELGGTSQQCDTASKREGLPFFFSLKRYHAKVFVDILQHSVCAWYMSL